MPALVEQILAQIISKKSFINNYPKPGVAFLNIDHLFNDPIAKKMVSDAVLSAIDPQSFDSVAGIASRGYIFSGIIANHLTHVGEQFIQKVKSKGDSNFVQIDTTTEYSADALQVLNNTVQKGKRYLLTDDLIATGGSVLTAIKLIKQCGGQVSSVFVMTELTDFGAKEKLKQEGVELVSLLQLSNQDLQKLLLMQEAYAASPSAPISYKLSHHEQGVQGLVQANTAPKLTVHLASQSSAKKEAIQLVCAGLFDPLNLELIQHEANSGVNSQPLGYIETLSGASNRMESIQDTIVNLDKSILISMENGIRYSEEELRYYDFVQVLVKKGDKTFSHTQDCCVVPTDIINAIAKSKEGSFQETWGDVAKRMGLAKDANNPHQEACFGGVSRSHHLFNALCRVLGPLKETLMKTVNPEPIEQCFTIGRLVHFNKSKDNSAQHGIFFAPRAATPNKSIELYNQGCPVNAWNIAADKVKRTDFKIFSTGDAFSILSPTVEVNGAAILINVGLEHEHYSPLVLLHEALQLCRNAYEHGAKEITIALPEQFHPALHSNDFNVLLMDLFKASGANKVFYFDNSYQGVLDEARSQTTMSLTLSDQANPDQYKIGRSELSSYLQLSAVQANDAPLDAQAMHVTRKNYLKQVWKQSNYGSNNLYDSLCAKHLPAEIEIPALAVKPHVLLCCSANRPLAEKIAADLRLHGELVKIYAINGVGAQANIPAEAELCGAEVTVVQSTRPNPDNLKEAREYKTNGASSYFFEAAMVTRQARLRGAETVNLINPYQFSARSDKAENNTKGKTGAYVQHNAMLLEAAGVNQVITAECHDAHTMSGSYTGKNIKGYAVPALSIMATRLASEWLEDPNRSLKSQLRLVTPDAGATKRTKELTTQLQVILGRTLCETRILGDKERSSHQDDSALINSLNSGAIDINADDKYLISDDESATGNTLCQAITNLKNSGAKDISVLVVHNNMPLDWLVRQLCLARFFYLGVNDLHFSDTQEMGTLASSYDDLINSYALMVQLPRPEIEERVFAWFKENLMEYCSDNSVDSLNHEFDHFKATFGQFQTKIRVHSLASEFAKQIRTMPYVETLTETKTHKKDDVVPPAGLYASNKGSLLFFPQVKKENSEKGMTPGMALAR